MKGAVNLLLWRPYDVDVNTVVHNYKRLAELWAQDTGLSPFFWGGVLAQLGALQVVYGARFENILSCFCKTAGWLMRIQDVRWMRSA